MHLYKCFVCSDEHRFNTLCSILQLGGSPAVHIVDMKTSPEHHRPSRKRLSSEGSDGSLPDKRPTPDLMPSTDNEYIIKKNPERRRCACTTPDRVKPVAMVSPIVTHSPMSPISLSVKKVPLMMQVIVIF